MKRYEILSFWVALKSSFRSPWTTFWAEVTIFTALFCRPCYRRPGIEYDANRAPATGLIIAAGIWLFGNGLRRDWRLRWKWRYKER